MSLLLLFAGAGTGVTPPPPAPIVIGGGGGRIYPRRDAQRETRYDTRRDRIRTMFERLAKLNVREEEAHRKRLARDDDDLLTILSGDE